MVGRAGVRFACVAASNTVNPNAQACKAFCWVLSRRVVVQKAGRCQKTGGAKDIAVPEGLSPLALRMAETIGARRLAVAGEPVLLLVSGGSDSTALAYGAAELSRAGLLGPLAVLHVNHLLRGEDADADARFVERLAGLLGLPCELHAVDVGAIARAEGGNVEAVGRRERYRIAADALACLCREAGAPPERGRAFTAHTRDDRVEGFYMRSIVGTGPGGFRSMRFLRGRLARPLLEASRSELRSFIEDRAAAGLPVARDEAGALWREDATNEQTDRFRAFVRAEIVPQAKRRNSRLLETLCRTMDLIADEDDFMEALAAEALEKHVVWEHAGFGMLASGEREAVRADNEAPAPDVASVGAEVGAPSLEAVGVVAGDRAAASESACVLAPGFGSLALPLRRRVVANVLRRLLKEDARIEQAAVEAVLAAFGADGHPIGGYVANIAGNLAVSANRRGVRIEAMAAFRRRRKKGRL